MDLYWLDCQLHAVPHHLGLCRPLEGALYAPAPGRVEDPTGLVTKLIRHARRFGILHDALATVHIRDRRTPIDLEGSPFLLSLRKLDFEQRGLRQSAVTHGLLVRDLCEAILARAGLYFETPQQKLLCQEIVLPVVLGWGVLACNAEMFLKPPRSIRPTHALTSPQREAFLLHGLSRFLQAAGLPVEQVQGLFQGEHRHRLLQLEGQMRSHKAWVMGYRAVLVDCPSCKARLRLPENKALQKIRCSRCKEPISEQQLTSSSWPSRFATDHSEPALWWERWRQCDAPDSQSEALLKLVRGAERLLQASDFVGTWAVLQLLLRIAEGWDVAPESRRAAQQKAEQLEDVVLDVFRSLPPEREEYAQALRACVQLFRDPQRPLSLRALAAWWLIMREEEQSWRAFVEIFAQCIIAEQRPLLRMGLEPLKRDFSPILLASGLRTMWLHFNPGPASLTDGLAAKDWRCGQLTTELLLHSDDASHSEYIYRFLHSLRTAEALPWLQELFERSSGELQRKVVESLGNLGTQETILWLDERREGWRFSRLNRAISSAIGDIRGRHQTNAEAGGLSMSESEGGELSVPPSEGGLSTPKESP